MNMLQENEILLQSYRALAEFLWSSLGSPSSTVLYQIDEGVPTGEIIAVYGPEADNRKIGDPLTPFIGQVVQRLQKSGASGLTHVDTEASTSAGRVKLHFFAIRRKDGVLIGLFIICTEIDLFYNIRDAVNRYLGYYSHEDTVLKATSSSEKGPDDAVTLSGYMQQLIRDEIEAFGIPVERMTNDERRALVHRLEKLEVFYARDSVKITAELLGVSVPTVYRLLKKEPRGVAE